MEIAVIVVNLVMIYIFTGGFLPEIGMLVGGAYTVISAIGTWCLRGKKLGNDFINSQLISLTGKGYDSKLEPVLLSITFLALGMKIGTALTLLVEIGAIAFLAFAILLASGYLFEGRKSGMTLRLAWNIAKIVIKVYQFISSIYEKIAEQIVKIELKILNLEIKGK